MPIIKLYIFIFAHQDDESALYFELEEAAKKNSIIKIFYLTTDNFKKSPIRNSESEKVLKKIGIQKDTIFYIGDELGIPDGSLTFYLSECIYNIKKKISCDKFDTRIYVHAWEGGHQDHDAAHVIGLMLASELNLLKSTYQFPIYRKSDSSFIFFKLFDLIDKKNHILLKKIPVLKRIKYMYLLFHYPSQWRTWVGLFPFYFLHYVRNGNQILQKINPISYKKKPHNGILLYEFRGFFKYSTLRKEIKFYENKKLLAIKDN